MPHGSITAHLPAPSAEVFALLHDYDRRLEWDTLLRAAYLTDGWPNAQLHATSVCQGRLILGGLALKTEYVSFSPPHLAAVKMINRPLFFETFAATIRHLDESDGTSRIEYIYNFTARPRWLRWLLHPMMTRLFRYETTRRLSALATYLRRSKNPTRPANR